MVLGIAMMAAMLPTMIGLNEATQGARDQDENRRNTNRKQRCHLVATCSLDQGTPELRSQVHNAQIQVGLDRKVSSVMQVGCSKWFLSQVGHIILTIRPPLGCHSCI
jgi:hypothetical protein